MLAPLFTDRRIVTIALRQFVTEGAELFVKGDLPGSLKQYAKAEEIADHTDSLFDELWISLNKVDTLIRAGNFEAARESLQDIVSLSNENGFRWLVGKALSVYGSTRKLSATYTEMLERIAEANQIFTHLDAPSDRIRPLYYSSIYHFAARDRDQALKLALESLRLVNLRDSFRISELDWLTGLILHNQGMTAKAVLFEKESLEQSQKVSNVTMQALTATTLAQLYESMADRNNAEETVKIAQDALNKMPPGFDQIRTEILLGLTKARIELGRKQYAKAESLLERNLEIYSRQPFRATPLLSPSLTLLAQAYSENGEAQKAGEKFNEAIDVVENDDQYLRSEQLRVKFDDERRDLYDSAIEFEYKSGSSDAAWSYLQRYRSKLFIEFLAQFDPNVAQAHAEALDRSHVQKLIPADAQVVEYALLRDRLLICDFQGSVHGALGSSRAGRRRIQSPKGPSRTPEP